LAPLSFFQIYFGIGGGDEMASSHATAAVAEEEDGGK
jgi:hypothetical protein